MPLFHDNLGPLRNLPRPDDFRTDPPRPRIRNVLTVDLEDWPVAVLGPQHDISQRVVRNTLRCLHILQWHGVRATFFVLGRVAEQFPELIRQAHDAGHEIASHGHGHELLTRLTPDAFADDVRRSLDTLECVTGSRPIGYRAPAFSIVQSTRWAGPILSDLGIRYSSSVFPIHHRRYGIADAPRGMHRWKDCDLLECPPATMSMLGRNWPVAGGGYFRLLPGSWVRESIRHINRAGRPAILYMHPYELDPGGVSEHRRAGVEVSRWREWTQEMFRGRFEDRLHRLLDEFQFTTLGECAAEHAGQLRQSEGVAILPPA